MGSRFVVMLGISVSDPADAEAFADRTTDQVETAIRLQRAAWYAGGVFATSVLIPVALTFLLGPVFVLLMPVVMFARAREAKRSPTDSEREPQTLSGHTEVVDLRHSEVFAVEKSPISASAAAAFSHPLRGLVRGHPLRGMLRGELSPEMTAAWVEIGKAQEECPSPPRLTSKRYNQHRFHSSGLGGLFFMAIAIPALTPMWWPSSLLWSALLGEWVLLRLMRNTWPLTSGAKAGLRITRWVIAAFAIVVVVDNVLGFSPVPLGHSPVVIGVLAAVAFATLLLYWRNGVADLSTPFDLKTSWLAMAYLVAGLLFAVAAGALIFGTNVDPFLGSQLVSKAMGLVLIVVLLPIVVRRHRAADLASRRASARARGTPEVILLRAFADDHLRIRSRRLFRNQLETMYYRSTEPFEDVVVRAFAAMGPVVAIAKPGTERSEFGAARDRVTGEDWLTAVKAALSRSAFVVVILGAGEGLTAEIEALRDLDVLDRVCLILPPVDPVAAAARLSYITGILDGDGEWGRIDTDTVSGGRVLALVGEGTKRFVVVWDRSPGSQPDRVTLSGRHDSSEAFMRLGLWIRTRRLAPVTVGGVPTAAKLPT